VNLATTLKSNAISKFPVVSRCFNCVWRSGSDLPSTGKCASRKIACVYPTGRKSSRKANMSGSPLSQGAADGSKTNSVSPAISNVDFKPMIFSSQTAQNQPMSAFAHNGLSAAQSNFQQQQANGHLGGNFGPQQLSYMAGPANPQSTVSRNYAISLDCLLTSISDTIDERPSGSIPPSRGRCHDFCTDPTGGR
jgi:hypothetical protein